MSESILAANLRTILHELETPMRGHDADGACCRAAADHCPSCPFAACKGCKYQPSVPR